MSKNSEAADVSIVRDNGLLSDKKTSLGKQAAIWLSEQVGEVGLTEAGRFFGISHTAVRYAWDALRLGKTPREKIRIAKDSEDPIAQRNRKLAYMRDYNARTREYHSAYNKQWYQDHKEFAKAKASQYRFDNPEKTRESQERWRDANKERLTEYNKVYQERNKERIARTAKEKRLAFFSEDPKGAWLYYTFQGARSRAKRLGLPYDDDLSGLVLPDFCPVLGLSLKYANHRKYPDSDSPSFDRIVPPRGYVASNLRVISWRANVLRRDASVDEIRRVLSYAEECLAQEENQGLIGFSDRKVA